MAWNKSEIVEAIGAKLKKKEQQDDNVLRFQLDYYAAVIDALAAKLSSQFTTATLRGMGGSGVVLRLSASEDGPNEPTKCVKFPHPTIALPGNFSLIEILDNEAIRLQSVHHQNIMPIDDVIELDLTKDKRVLERDRRVPCYVMPFVEAKELNEFLATPEASSADLIRTLVQVAEALEYLHGMGLVHLDVKPGNILVRRDIDGIPNAILSDFGFCKQLHDMAGGSRTLVLGTDGYIDPDLLAEMPNRTDTDPNRIRDKVRRVLLNTQYDRYALGGTILDCIATFLSSQTDDREPRTIPTRLLRGLQFVALRCAGRHAHDMVIHPKHRHRRIVGHKALFEADVGARFRYSKTSEMAFNLKSLTDGAGLGQLENEVLGFSTDALCLPPRTFAVLTNRVTQTIDSIPVRRLASIAQLALCYHVYPGASHTRKEHVIGTYQITAQFLHQILQDAINPCASLILNRRHQCLALLAALLHDLAHIPLLHDLEDSVSELTQERLTSEILSGKWGDVTFVSEIDRVLGLWGVSRAELQVVLGRKDRCEPPCDDDGKPIPKDEWESLWEQPEYEVVRSLIDGAVDADKVDYLHRDAIHAGVQFGYGVDLARLERQLTGALWLETSSGKGASWRPRCRIAATTKGQAAAEALIGVRHNMHAQVYGHRTVRAARSMLNYVAWLWQIAECHAQCTQIEIADRVFAYASGLRSLKGAQDLFQQKEPDPGPLEPQMTDNLPYAEAKLIRWMAAISGVRSAKLMAEKTIKRQLYKTVCELSEGAVATFLDRSYPKTGRQKLRAATEWGAIEWLSLTDFLDNQVSLFLQTEGSQLIGTALRGNGEDTLPKLLVDVALPKTMRSQKALKIQRDFLGATTTWGRLDRIKDTSGCISGLDLEDSRVYEVYGGSGESVASLVVRVFARPDLADSLRAHLDTTTAAGWLNSFSPGGVS